MKKNIYQFDPGRYLVKPVNDATFIHNSVTSFCALYRTFDKGKVFTAI